jgi:hypothetical protein
MGAQIGPDKRDYRNVGIWPIRLAGQTPIRGPYRIWIGSGQPGSEVAISESPSLGWRSERYLLQDPLFRRLPAIYEWGVAPLQERFLGCIG